VEDKTAEANQKMIHYYGLYTRTRSKKIKKAVERLIRFFLKVFINMEILLLTIWNTQKI